MRFSPVAVIVTSITALLPGLLFTPAARANITIKDRSISQPLVLDQNEDYYLHKVFISGVTDFAALTLTGKINSVNLSNCVFSNVWSGMNGKATAAEAQGAIVGSFVATDTAFEDAQHQLLCLREGAFGTVSFQRCKFRTTDSFLKRIYANDPWRTTPPTTEFANIERLELIDNEYLNTTLIIHPSVKMVIFRGDVSNVRLQSPSTHVIRLERGQDPATIGFDGTAVASTNADGHEEGELKDRPRPSTGADQAVTASSPAKSDNADTGAATEAAADAPTPVDPVGSKDALIVVQDP
jgi:hypothetical protein